MGLWFLGAFSHAWASPSITTIAGNPVPNGTATNIGVGANGVFLDSSGNVYFTDSSNHAVRKLNTTTGIITVLAGTGSSGSTGDGGPATSARLNAPRGVTLDGSGNVYIADTNNHRIRKIDTSGNISTFAGTGTSGSTGDGAAATAARLNFPQSVAFDSSGNLYIADTSNHKIRKIDTSGTITTFAGTTSGNTGDGAAATLAKLSFPRGVAFDSSGNLYIADTSNHRIRKVNTSGIISTFAGTTSGFSGDGGLATSAQISGPQGVSVDSSNNVYVTDTANHRIRKIATNGNISTLAGSSSGFSGDGGLATSAQLASPVSTCPDSSGNLYIGDTSNSRLRKIDTSGNISTVAGTGSATFGGDGGPATIAQFSTPQGTAVDSSGNIYMADSSHHRIRKIDTSGNISTYAGTGTAGLTGDGGPATSARINTPLGIFVDSSDNLYIADGNNSRIRKVDTSGNISTVVGTSAGFSGDNGLATSAQINSPFGVGVDSAGNIYIGDTGNQRIRKVDTSGTITTFAGTGSAGNGGDGGAATSAQINTPMQVVADGSGNIYITDYGNSRIRKIDTNGIITAFAGTGVSGYSGDNGPATSAQLNSPRSIAIDSSGNLYIADSSNSRIRKVTPGGTITTVAGTSSGFSGDNGPATSAQLASPQGVAVSAAGLVYISDTSNRRVRRVVEAQPLITSSLTASATLNVAFGGYTITADFAPDSYSATGLPTGLSVNTATGAITGTPTQLGAFNVSIAATNGAGTSLAATLVLTVNPVVLTVTGITANNKAYDTTTTATLNLGSAVLSGVVGGDVVTLNTSGATATFANASVGAGKTVTVAGLTLSGANAGNYTLTPPTTTAAITQAPLSVTGITASNKTYDQSTAATINTASAALSGVFTGETVTLVTGSASATFATAAVGNSKTVTVAGLSLGGAQSGNYTLTQPTTTANITTAPLTVTGITASNKTYDGSTGATLNTASAALSGVFSGETVTLSTASAIGSFSNESIGTGKTVVVSGLTLGGADAGNYTLTQPTTTANITSATLTVTGITASNKSYDAATTATLNTSGATLVGVIFGDTVTLNTASVTGAFSSASVGTGKTVTIAGLSLGGANGGNYTLTQPTTTANITSASLTVTGITASNKIYDATTAATLTTTGAALSGIVLGDTVTLDTSSATGAFSGASVGTGLTVTVAGLTLGGSSSSNYSLTQPTTTADITGAPLTVSGITASNKTYNQSTAATINVASAALSGIILGDTVTLDASSATGAFSSASVGTGKTVTISGLVIGGASSGNYLLTPPTTTADITGAPLTVTGITANNKIYDATAAATLNTGSAALSGILSGDTVTLNAGGAAGAFSGAGVGTGLTVTISGLVLGGAEAGNYVLTQPTAAADITAAPLTVTGITAANKTYNRSIAATLNTSSAALSGVVLGDTVTLGTISATGAFSSASVGTGKTVTISGLILGGASSANYSLTQPTTTADITRAPLTVAGVTVANKSYDATAAATLNWGSAVLVGILSGDTVTLNAVSATGTFSSVNVGTGLTVTISGFALSGADAGNYSLTQPTATASITRAALAVTGITVSNKGYDGTTVATLNTTSAALSGIVLGDTVTLDTSSAVGAFANPAVGTGKPVTVTGLVIGGASSANYTLTPPTLTADITRFTLTVTGITSSNKTYDATATATLNNTGSAVLVGILSGDTVTLNVASAAGTFSSAAVGTGKTVTVAGLALGGANSGNYTLIQPTTTADITAAPVTVTGITAANKGYDGSTAATLITSSAVLVGILGSDTVTLDASSATGTFADPSVGTGKGVTISGLTLTGADAGNYLLTPPTTTADITQNSAVIAFGTLSFTYNGAPHATTATTTPAGLPLTLTYDGSATAPSNAGTYTVAAVVNSGTYSASASATLTIARAAQTIAVANPGALTVGTPVVLSAAASSGLSVTFSVISGSATISGRSVTATAPGSLTLRATQAGDGNYLPATSDVTVVAGVLSQTITFAALPDKKTTDAAFTLSATSSSALPVTFAVASGPASISGSTLTLNGTPGVVSVVASQAGDATYAAATAVTRTFNVGTVGTQVFFGTTAANDKVGAYVSADSTHGTIIGYLAGTGEGFVCDFTVDGSGAFEATAHVFPGSTGSATVSATTLDGSGNATTRTAAAAAPRTFRGTVVGGTLSGTVVELGLAFSANLQPNTGTTSGIAGYYVAPEVDTSSGSVYSVINAQNEIYVLAVSAGKIAANTGTVNSNGTFSVTSSAGAAVNGSVDPATTAVSGTFTWTDKSTQSFSGLSSVTPRSDRLYNLSSRGFVGTGQNILIAGFIVSGSDSKTLAVRAVGPALTNFGLNGALAGTVMRLFDARGQVLLTTTGGGNDAALATTFARVGAFPLTAADSAAVVTLAPGAYTLHVIGVQGATGVGLAEVYDASANPGMESQRLINISSRGFIGVGENVLIGGFIITGNSSKRVLVRAVGPGLAAYGVSGAIADPQIALFSGDTVIAQNNNWETPLTVGAAQVAATPDELIAAQTQVGAFQLGAGSRDAALIITLAPGLYTAIASGVAGQTGTALMEIYEIPAN